MCLAFGDEEAMALGLDVGRLRLMVIACATLMTAVAVAIGGLIGLVGLVVPYLGRLVVGSDDRALVPVCAVLGGCYLLLVDDIARSLLSQEIPLGILTSLLGGARVHISAGAHPKGLGMIPPHLAVQGLSCGHGGRVVVRDVDFTLSGGEFLCLLGPNGVGKTTLFKTVLRLMPSLGGRILVDGEDIAGWSRRKIATAVGYVPQAHTPPFPFEVGLVVAMGRTAHLGPLSAPGREDALIAEEAMDFGWGSRIWPVAPVRKSAAESAS